jgi:hypothetical protein
MVTVQGFFDRGSGPQSVAHLHSFSCEAWRHARPLGFAGAALRAAIGADWRRGAQAERFDCGQLCVEARGATWTVLDGEPICFETPIGFRFLPRAVETVAFEKGRDRAVKSGLQLSAVRDPNR